MLNNPTTATTPPDSSSAPASTSPITGASTASSATAPVSDKTANYPRLSKGEAIREADLAKALGVQLPSHLRRLTFADFKRIDLEWLRAWSEWAGWHLKTQKIAIVHESKLSQFRALFPGEQLAHAEKIRESHIEKSISKPAALIENILAETPEEQAAKENARLVQHQRKAALRGGEVTS